MKGDRKPQRGCFCVAKVWADEVGPHLVSKTPQQIKGIVCFLLAQVGTSSQYPNSSLLLQGKRVASVDLTPAGSGHAGDILSSRQAANFKRGAKNYLGKWPADRFAQLAEFGHHLAELGGG
jgi:hypothetical protein